MNPNTPCEVLAAGLDGLVFLMLQQGLGFEFSDWRASSTRESGTSAWCSRAQAKRSWAEKQQQWFQQSAARIHPHWRCWHGNGLERSFAETTGRGSPNSAAN